jgi:O-phospho-L-seryl-tRNASec:L-selenocysteinyl-tRNA synthase
MQVDGGFNTSSNPNNLISNPLGRASSSQTLDVLMTLLSLGKDGYLKLVRERKQNFDYLKEKLNEFANKHSMHVYGSKNNRISLALALDGISNEQASMIGSMLFKRGVSGCRVVNGQEEKTIGGYCFSQWGSHTNSVLSQPYLTVAASLGVTSAEIDTFFVKLESTLKDLRRK